jgi:WD40 repeat protein/energy-coupling factor transporter ATP-binding protein EcfA2
MNKPLDPEDNSPSDQQPNIQLNLDSSTLDGGMQALQGEGNTQIQGQVVTFNQTQILQIPALEIKKLRFIQNSPYKGLRTFEPEDKDLFFGRDQFLTGLVNELEQTNLILLLGASGSGKSSVVRAGLIPWLTQKWGSSRLVNLTFTPYINPFESFYVSLHSKFKQTPDQIAEAKSGTLTEVVTRLKKPDEYWFIFIDQFEELFTTSEGDKCDQFIASLVKLSQAKLDSVKIMATMRADFLDRLDPYSALEKVTRKHRPMITAMEPDELWLAIEQPAARHGVVFETELIKEIIKDIQGQAGYLPLLQYTLNLLWETEVQIGSIYDRTLKISNYRSLGGVRGALQKHVEEVYQALSNPEQLAAQRIFLKLVGIAGDEESGTEWKPLRRRANQSEFSNQLEQQVLNQLINQNLLVSNRPYQSQESTIEIAHEILLTSWTKLNTWIRENRLAIALRNRLNDDVDRWQAKKAEDELWGGSKLEQVLELRKDIAFNEILGGFSKDANQFIDISVGKRDRQRRRTITILAGFSTVALTTALIAFYFYLEAARQKVNAELKSLSLTSEKLFFAGKNFDALLEGLRAGKQVGEQSGKVRDDTRMMVVTTLQQAVDGVRELNRLERYNYSVNSVSFIEDLSQIASSNDDGTIQIWNRQGEVLQEWKVPGKNPVDTIISFDPVHKMIASASNEYDPEHQTNNNDGTITQGKFEGFITLWNLNGTVIKTWKGHTAEINSLSFILNGTAIASASYDKTIKLWGLDGKPLRTLRHRDRVSSISFSPNSQMLVSSSLDGYITLWSIDSDKAQKTWKASDDFQTINSVSFSSDGQTIVSGGSDTTVKLWNRDGSLLETLEKHQDEVKSVSFSHDGQTIASTSMDRTIKLWKADGTFLMSLQGHSDEVNSVSFSPDNKILASASTDNTVKLWSLRNSPHKILSHDDGVNSVSFSPDKQKIISVGDRGSIKLWQRDGSLLKTLAEQGEEINSVSFSPDSKTVVVAGIDQTIELRDTDGRSLFKKKGHDAAIKSVSFSPNGKIIASASEDKTIKLWRIDGSPLKTLSGHSGHTHTVNSVSFSPNGEILASASNDGTIKLWNTNGSLLRTLAGHTDGVRSISFSPDGKLLVSASNDSTVRVWNLNGGLLKTFKGHNKWINSASFSPDGKVVVSGSADKTVKFWSLDDGSEIKTLQDHQAKVTSVSFSPDGNILASADENGKVILWNLDLEDLIRQSCSWLSDYLRTNPNVSKSDRSFCKNN